jgi:uncharacterized protein YkwD
MTRKIGALVALSLLSVSACQSSSDSGSESGGGTASSNGGSSQSSGGSTQTAAGTNSSSGAPGVAASAGATSTNAGNAGATTGGASAGGSGGVSAAGAAGTGMSGAGGMSMDVCTRWKADRADLSEGTWSGAVASCTAGDLSADARANSLRIVNLYRFLAALPPVTTDPTFDASDQACALMMLANNALSHTPPQTWTCWTQQGSDAAGSSNIDSGPAVGAVDAYMIDTGNETTLGHRRWILSNSLGPIGIGGTNKSSCMHTLDGKGKAGKPWMAWPSAGTIPLQALVQMRGESVDKTGWSIQSDNIDLRNAMVTVTVDGASQPVTVTQLEPDYGASYAIDFIPKGWTTQAGKTYSVSVAGVSTPIAYQVAVVDCQ